MVANIKKTTKNYLLLVLQGHLVKTKTNLDHCSINADFLNDLRSFIKLQKYF